MAKDNVKKGFLFYFCLFLLIIVAALLIMFVVMLFMPGTSIIGLEYFTNNSVYHVTSTTDESAQTIDFANPSFSAVEINAGYSEVSIQNNNLYEQSGVYIVNNSKGFVASAQAVDYAVSVTIEGGVLKIDVTEQNAFLYFSKDVKIILHIANNADLQPFENKKITINTTEGGVKVGGDELTGNCHQVNIGSLNATTQSGDIRFSSLADESYEAVALTTDSGDITLSKNVTANNLQVQTGSGSITAQTLASQNQMILNSTSGRVTVQTVSGSVSSKFRDAYVTVGNVTGDWTFDSSDSGFRSSIIMVNSVGGNFTATNGQDTRFEIGDIGGVANITTGSGSVSVFANTTDGRDMSKGLHSGGVIRTNSGYIDVNIASSSTSVTTIDTRSGNINLTMTEVFNWVNVWNETATTNISLPSESSVSIRFHYYGQDTTEGFVFDNVNLNNDNLEVRNPVVNNYGNQNIYVKCNRQVNFSWT